MLSSTHHDFFQLFFFIYKKVVKFLSDWPLQHTLLDVFVSISCSQDMQDTLEEMRTLRNRFFEDTDAEVALRSGFLRVHGPAFRMWLLQSSHSCHAAKRQLMWHTFQAKYHGLSRSGIHALSTFNLLCPLTSLDRHWKKLISRYQATTRCKSRATY